MLVDGLHQEAKKNLDKSIIATDRYRPVDPRLKSSRSTTADNLFKATCRDSTCTCRVDLRCGVAESAHPS